ncbi:hypothetical protein KSF78_0001871 [Schistosoma japonicum]|nr:hypothetical protein KSF78_0001871 [Schistosoma japonicum]
MLSKSPTFHVPSRHIYEHQLQPKHYYRHRQCDLAPHLNQHMKNDHFQIFDSNMSQSEIVFSSKVNKSSQGHIKPNTTTNNSNNISDVSYKVSCLTTSSNDNDKNYAIKDFADIDDDYEDDVNNIDNDIDDDDDDNDDDDEDNPFNKDEIDELFFIIPTEINSNHQLNYQPLNTFTIKTKDEEKLYNDNLQINLPNSFKLPNLKERITHTQNIWCLPNLSRYESERLLRFAEIGVSEIVFNEFMMIIL